MEWWQAIILGVVEGITEYLPVSSTGHLIITSSLLGLDQPEEVKRAVDAFNIVIQGGAILAVAGLYWPRIVQMLKGALGRDASGRKLLFNIVIAFLPAAILGPLLSDRIEEHLFSPGPVLAALFLGGLWMIWLGKRGNAGAKGSSDDADKIKDAESLSTDLDVITWKKALAIGLFQCVAMWPGTSRSMMTIAGGTMLGLRPKQAAEFSFLLGLPTLGGACVYRFAKDLHSAHANDHPTMFEQLGLVPVLLGCVTAFIAAAFSVRWLVAFLTRHGLAAFGWYRIALCAVMGALILAGLVRIG